jgi:hypothetical protein
MFSSVKRFPLGMTIGIAGFLITLPFSFLDFDTHHDGVMLAPAIAVAEGVPLFSGAFSQYGPVTHWLHGAFLFVWPFGDALGLRVINTLLVAITAALMTDVARVAPQGWKIRQSHLGVLSICWILANDVLIGVPMLPWSSVVATLILVLIVWLFASYESNLGRDGNGSRVFFIGALLALLPGVRQTVGFTLIALIILFAPLIVHRLRSSAGLPLIALAGFSFGASAMITPIWLTQSIIQWINQTFLWPISWASEATLRGSPLVGALATTFIACAVIGSMLFLWLFQNRLPRLSVVGTSVFLVLTVLGLFSGNQELFVATEFVESGLYRWSDWVMELSSRGLWVLFGLGLFALLSLLALVLRNVSIRESSNSMFAPLLLVVVSLASITQIYPVADSRHIWWAIPPSIISFAWLLGRFPKFGAFGLWFPVVGVWVSSLVLVAGANLLLVERTQYHPDSVAAGMWGRADRVEEVENAVKLAQSLGNIETSIFLVSDGYLSVVLGDYSSADQYFVSWGPLEPIEERVKREGQLVFVNEDTKSFLENIPTELIGVSIDNKILVYSKID